jgi:hypothetical protein
MAGVNGVSKFRDQKYRSGVCFCSGTVTCPSSPLKLANSGLTSLNREFNEFFV